MKKLLFFITAALVLNLITSCQKDQDIEPGAQDAIIGFTIDLDDSSSNDGNKSTTLQNWNHPIDVILIEMTNVENGTVFTEEFASIEALTMLVPVGKYNVSISTLDNKQVSEHLQFSSEMDIVVSGNKEVTMNANKTQSLLTISNSEVTPLVNNNSIFERDYIHYAYITNWDGNWQYGDDKVTTSEAPVPGKMYHFKVAENGSIEEGIEEWDNNYESILDRLVQSELYDASNPNGFLLSADSKSGAIWKNGRSDQSADPAITATIAHVLHLSDYTDVSKLGYEANWHYVNDGNKITGASLYGLVGGYEATRDPKYKALAEQIIPIVREKFSPKGTNPARAAHWGYDYINYLEGARKAAIYGIAGAEEYYNTLLEDYLANYQQKAQDDYQRLYINAIFDRLGVGEHQGTVEWNHSYNLQDAAVGLMGESWNNPVNIKKYMINNLLLNAKSAEDLAEAVYALSLK